MGWQFFDSQGRLKTVESTTVGGAWKGLYQNSAGALAEIALGASGTVYRSAGASSVPGFSVLAPSELTGGNWKVLYTNGSGVVTELALGTSGQVLQSNGASSAPTFATPAAGGGGGVSGALLPGLIGRFTTPIDVTISADTTLTARVNYFKNLTVNTTKTLTGIAGGTVIIVEETLTCAGIISVNALGGRGGAAASSTVVSGGGAWGRGAGSTITRSQGSFISLGTISASNPYAMARFMQAAMPTGGAAGAGVGAAGGAWPINTSGPFDTQRNEPIDYLLMLHLWELIQAGLGNDNAQTGAIGGGGGGGGGQAATASPAGGIMGGPGMASGAFGNAAGGSGVGAGGAGGTGTGATAGAGGRGGGVILIICKTLDNTGGVISANGANGANGATAGGGGGGGGGGAVVVAYETLTAAGTLQANGGTAGTAGGGSGSAGGAGGAGVASSFMIRAGS